MKRTITFTLVLALASIIAFVNPLQAQNAAHDMNALAKKFESAYNHKDAKAIKGMYTIDAVRTNTDGTITTGNAAISDSLAVFFKRANVTIKIMVDKSSAEANGTITASGTYHVTGTTGKGEKIDIKGAFDNTNVKENGQWKISKSVLKSM